MFAARDVEREFFRIWTMKESLVKAKGTGFNGEPSGFDVFSETELKFFILDYLDGYLVTVCSRDKDVSDCIIFLEP